MAAAPVAVRLCADVEGHADAVARVELRAPHLGRCPVRAEVALAHLRIGLEPARRENHAACADGPLAVGEPGRDPGDAGLQADRLSLVRDGYAGPLGELEEAVGEPNAAADGLDDEAAPEAEPAATLERLPPVGEGPADATVAQPGHRGVGPGGEDVRQAGVGPAAGHAHHVALERGLGVLAEVGPGDFALGQVGYEVENLVGGVVGEPEEAAGEVGVAAAEVVGGLLHNEYGGAGFCRGEGGAQGGVARPHYDNVVACVSEGHGGRYVVCHSSLEPTPQGRS